MSDVKQIMATAKAKQVLIPAFNVPYPPMIAPTIQALADTGAFGLLEIAYIEWKKFQATSLEGVYHEYQKYKDARYTRLHLDHIPVIDEDDLPADYVGIISNAIKIGYDSVMVDGSKLSLAENIRATRQIVALAHPVGIAVEGELGAIVRETDGPLPSYEELFASGRGFTDLEEAVRFVRETGVDWLSVSIGNLHGSISSLAGSVKTEARLAIDHLAKINRLLDIPLVLHGGSGIPTTYIKQGMQQGIAKMNIGFVIRKVYEELHKTSVVNAQQAVYHKVIELIDEMELRGAAEKLQNV
ncbi:class II fructose-bisphosphate aldolase [candidate division KSB1 bacterium]|nr:class II fructose-bisphosphate aldolase [candidate division KSB1 bacterium]